MKKKAILVLLACSVFNLTVGVLYTWNMFKLNMMAPVLDGGWAWSSLRAGLPYTIAIMFFSVGVFTGGRLQCRFGPRLLCTAGGFLVGLGLIFSGFAGANSIGIALGFGVMTGMGIGLGYSSVLPTALRWFHTSKKGTVSGFVTGGFCLAAVYLAPVSTFLLNNFSIEYAMKLLGVLVLGTSILIAQFIKNPPTGYVPEVPEKKKIRTFDCKLPDNLTSSEIIRTNVFRLFFVIFLINVSIGLMIIGNIASIAYSQADISDYGILTFLLSLLAVTNFVGRLAGGIISDKLGRINTLFIVMFLQMLNMAVFGFYSTLSHLIFGAIIAGFSFGAVLSIFPAFTADVFGLKNQGANYGLIFLAYGASGVVAPVIADYFYDIYQSFLTTYIICSVLLLGAIAANYRLKREIYKCEKKYCERMANK